MASTSETVDTNGVTPRLVIDLRAEKPWKVSGYAPLTAQEVYLLVLQESLCTEVVVTFLVQWPPIWGPLPGNRLPLSLGTYLVAGPTIFATFLQNNLASPRPTIKAERWVLHHCRAGASSYCYDQAPMERVPCVEGEREVVVRAPTEEELAWLALSSGGQ